MSAVWAAARAAVRRRRLQSWLIGLVVLCATTTVVLALGLLTAARGSFDEAFEQQRGAHAVVTVDRAKVSDAALSETGRRAGVAAAAGPYGQRVVDVPEELAGRPPGPLTVVGRAGAGGAVDRVELVAGRWAKGPGEIVLSSPNGGYDEEVLGSAVRARGVPPLTVVGFANSMSGSADGWVTPDQMRALGPESAQMLYRFDASGTAQEVADSVGRATAGLPEGAVASAQSYVTLRAAFSSRAEAYLPFVSLFGVLGLLVSVLIVGNVVSGAVVSGFRHIGVLKALGFTPNQVVSVYLVMVSVPTVAGCVLGAVGGWLVAQPVLEVAFSGVDAGVARVEAAAWVPVACVFGMPLLVVVTALVPALRAHRLPAARAITAGSAPATGRGLWVQRVLGGSRLPRAVSLGLGHPFARPGRTGLTVAAIVLGVVTVTVTTGLSATLVSYSASGLEGSRVDVMSAQPGLPPPPSGDGKARQPSKRGDVQIEELLRSLPGASGVTARGLLQVRMAGYAQLRFVNFYRGDPTTEGLHLIAGRVPEAAGEVMVGPAFLAQHGLALGDRISLELNGRTVPGRVAGELSEGDERVLHASWATLEKLAPGTKAIEYAVQVAPDASPGAYADAVMAADPGLYAVVGDSGNNATTTVVGFSSVFTLLLGTVAALGVLNSVVLNVRERQRDLGMLKSIGMTPRQVVAMTVTSAALLGAVGGMIGVPLGMGAHRWVVEHVGIIVFPESMKDVWEVRWVVALGLSGVLIAVLGAVGPARRAGRMGVAGALRNE
ncbi:hypothetical protein GCM10010329_73790 [Streptomyces spiroverticillatus]|uniref:FtsX-like permease family protein n=1 Tax=Streptomyces finlayi TaxID=67296 RepID=A0A918X6I8_9ACTN|nr:FtsX-like permease family protein [Streptomyces finlayi]GHA39803.1 hypothetical protein GCM10010329_73790 [Streptomyces spiroverticillatus]GHD14579.1 hypothetical protein GCM10010334_73950 [Streptomyces finlayi]